VRVASFNILNGRSLSDGEVNVGRLRDAIKLLDADVLGLQEVDRDQPRSHGLDLTAEVAAAMGGEGRFAPAMIGTPGERWRPTRDRDPATGPAYGIGLVSRLPVTRWLVTRLPFAPVRSPIVIPGPRRKVLWLRDEPRVLIAAVLATPTGPMTVANTHLSFVPGWNGAQLRRAARAVRSLPAPRLLLGDLNLWLPMVRAVSRRGWRPLVRGRTFPNSAPGSAGRSVQIDHVLAGGGDDRLRVRHSRVAASPISDHRALVVDLEVG
jgi:endonuclease/exonuclease/phosphatase family metal-dependent hydrolase